MHRTVEPAILYFGTPVVLVSSVNEDGSPNVAPMSSAWWLGQDCMLGFGARSKTPANILRTGECVLNLPSVDQVARGRSPGADHRLRPGAAAQGGDGLPLREGQAGGRRVDAVPSDLVAPPRILECPVQLEATLAGEHPIAAGEPERAGKLVALEVRIQRVHIDEDLLMAGHRDRIDPDKWRPLIMSFTQFYGLGQRVHESELAKIPESAVPLLPGPAARAVPGNHAGVMPRCAGSWSNRMAMVSMPRSKFSTLQPFVGRVRVLAGQTEADEQRPARPGCARSRRRPGSSRPRRRSPARGRTPPRARAGRRRTACRQARRASGRPLAGGRAAPVTPRGATRSTCARISARSRRGPGRARAGSSPWPSPARQHGLRALAGVAAEQPVHLAGRPHPERARARE